MLSLGEVFILWIKKLAEIQYFKQTIIWFISRLEYACKTILHLTKAHYIYHEKQLQINTIHFAKAEEKV